MKREFKWALIMSILSLIWLVALMYLGFQKGSKANSFLIYSGTFYIAQFFLYLLAIAERKKKQRGFISRRDGFYTGLIVTLFFVILVPAIVLIFNLLINPDFFTDMAEAAVLAGENIYEAEEQYNLWSYISNSMILGAIIGGMSSALAALLLEKKPSKKKKNESMA